MNLSFLLLPCLLLLSEQVAAFNVTLAARVEGGDKPTITGTTNLPDGIDLMISIKRKESQYMAQDKVKVKDGVFRSAEFSQKGAGLNPGKYLIEVMMPMAAVQPPATWPVIGNEGSKLEGPLVKKGSFGGKSVTYVTSITIGAGKVSPEQDRKAREQDLKDKHDWWLRSCTDNCKLVQGLARTKNEAFDWDRCYYQCVADEPRNK